MEQFLIQCFIVVFGAGWQEDVAPDVLMDAFAVCAQACEGDGHVLIKFNCNLKKIHVARSGMEINCSISLPEFGRQSKCESTAGSQLLPLQTKHCKKFCVCRMLRVFGRLFLNFLLQQGPLVVKGQFRQATKMIFTVFFFFLVVHWEHSEEQEWQPWLFALSQLCHCSLEDAAWARLYRESTMRFLWTER